MRLSVRITAVGFALAAMLGPMFVVTPQEAQAVVGSQFDPGNIVSDEVFYNPVAMSQTEIQSFLETKIGNCLNLLCLNVLRVDTPNVAAETYCGFYQGVGGESAAAIIFKVQQACGISAKVLLVTLQKEQGLVTRSSPSDAILRKAMGMGCPDTSVCDAQYYGFFNQMYAAARQLNRYNNGSFTYIKVGQYNNVRWNPNAACGGSSVLIRNKATAALYYYTPYQPNGAALANVGGLGDGCSSYGNRNFWVYFSDWFGSTQSEIGGNSIRAAYAATGGTGGALGSATSNMIPMSHYGGGLGQAFQNGSIYWSPRTGARIVSGNMLPYYFSTGGAAGPLAWPNSGSSVISQNGGGTGQSFQNGSVYSSPTAGTWSVNGSIRTAYWNQNGSAGPLGWPVAESLSISAGGGGTSQGFQNGSIYNRGTGIAFATSGAIQTRYIALNGPSGALSWPVSAIMTVSGNGGGTAQQFAGGSIYSSPVTGTWEVKSGIRDFYFSANGSAGPLGWPTAASICANVTSCSQTFQNGAVSWSSGPGGRLTSSEIAAAYANAGGESGELGRVTSGILVVAENGGGLAQAFENGSIYSKPSAGAFAVSDNLRTAYFARSGAAGPLGWPLAAADCSRVGGGCGQKFEKGWLYATPDGVSWTSVPEIDSVYAAQGSHLGNLGRTTSGPMTIPQNGGGLGQSFVGGSIYSTTLTGGFAVSGAIRQLYFELGGSAGSLGWPTGAPTCGGSDGDCIQAFQRGSIVTSKKSGTRVALPAIEELYADLGGQNGELGIRTSTLMSISQNGGGFGQAYTRGSIYSSSAGTQAVTGSIRDFYFAQGGSAGGIGWPTSAAVCGQPLGGCAQTFQGGRITWSPDGGARLN
ncbi:hypothetical protein [Cryobacterium ruanii]|uniref:LGFP repeat-containing protein n=1 Tax=Cryobacterium ruanii TaxID=1259197 RepID=A0A4R9ATB4_9MICO|nr:hypothetical protein [Cryobacterium ruanii]TFD69371.1 hypothetical protein E3T47_00790 [Cryobacterium ruanii]